LILIPRLLKAYTPELNLINGGVIINGYINVRGKSFFIHSNSTTQTVLCMYPYTF
jgi:hypothetical protein